MARTQGNENTGNLVLIGAWQLCITNGTVGLFENPFTKIRENDEILDDSRKIIGRKKWKTMEALQFVMITIVFVLFLFRPSLHTSKKT